MAKGSGDAQTHTPSLANSAEGCHQIVFFVEWHYKSREKVKRIVMV